MFKPVNSKVDFPKLERDILERWCKEGIVDKYLKKNNSSKKKFSFLDGPITANNPMGVHHAWGRTYKDFWQRFWNMQGYKQRFQNGFDEQGLWVEVEVEKELGLGNKKDIENLVPGDKFKSLEKFINLCKERVKKFSAIQTEQSKRLGYFMDWDNSYHTSSDENNYAIWNFLKVVSKRGWLYKGHDTVPWCPRCGTAISQHEILTEEYEEITHDAIYFKLPLVDRKDEYLLVWTTTPWTIPANVAAAVNSKEKYALIKGPGNDRLWIMEKRSLIKEKSESFDEKLGKELLGWKYNGPFDDFPLVKKTLGNYARKVIDGGDLVTETEGTGLLHVAPGAGEEDFKLAKENNLPVIAPIEEDASYVEGMGEFSGRNAKKHPEIIIDYLKEKENGRFLLKIEKYTHRYPTCWRCKKELVWRVVDEWYIAMDKKDESGKTYREQMIEVAKKIIWMPDWGLDRELDWLKNMHDWLISKKRYWGLALPIWECKKCGNFQVIGGKEELQKKSVSGWMEFEGHSPHRPWIDEIKMKCKKCAEITSRIPDVGNPWLDAGIVPFSTLPENWRPADFITESFPGQFKNWFYALIAMSTALKREVPVKRILGFGSVRDEKGKEMHKSRGNAIEFNEGSDKIGVDVMRWLYLKTNPEHNVNFGYRTADEVRGFFHLRLWNVYSFFVSYANLNKWKPPKKISLKYNNLLDRWILSRMTGNIANITDGGLQEKDQDKGIKNYVAYDAVGQAEIFAINDLSLWYVRRIRERIKSQENDYEDALLTLWIILKDYSRVLSPFIPFISENIYSNVMSLNESDSVHLAEWPKIDIKYYDENLEKSMQDGREIASQILMRRKSNNVPVKIPLKKLFYIGPKKLDDGISKIVSEEVNVYEIEYKGKSDQYSSDGPSSEVTDSSNQDLIAGRVREIIRGIQSERKRIGTKLDEKIDVVLEDWPKEFEQEIKKRAMVANLQKGPKFVVTRK